MLMSSYMYFKIDGSDFDDPITRVKIKEVAGQLVRHVSEFLC